MALKFIRLELVISKKTNLKSNKLNYPLIVNLIVHERVVQREDGGDPEVATVFTDLALCSKPLTLDILFLVPCQPMLFQLKAQLYCSPSQK